MKASVTELRKMPPDELRRELRTRRAEYAKSRMAIELGSEKNHSMSKSMRRDIARMMMVAEGIDGIKKSKTMKKAKRNDPDLAKTESSSLSSLPSLSSSSSAKKPVQRSSSKKAK